MSAFSVGDRVRCIVDYGEGATYGDTGTVIGGAGDWSVWVEWDEYRSCRHSCGGRCEDHHGWNVPGNHIEFHCDVLDLGDLPKECEAANVLALIGG